MNKISSSTRAGSLFRRRWLDYIRHQTGVLRTAFDGVVLLYIGIPGLLLLGRVYYGLWQDVLPSWLTGLPFQAVPVALILLTLLLGGLVLYIEAADVLFLKQHPKWVREIMLRATSLALVQRLVVISTRSSLATAPVMACLRDGEQRNNYSICTYIYHECCIPTFIQSARCCVHGPQTNSLGGWGYRIALSKLYYRCAVYRITA